MKTEEVYTKEILKEKILDKLKMKGIARVSDADGKELYRAVASVVKDVMLEKRNSFLRRRSAIGSKRICYLCMEFLVGRGLFCDTRSLGIHDELCEALEDIGSSFDFVFSNEKDPSLGNGGLGRLAACFMDSLTSLGYAADGYSLLYENGLFKQKIIDGEQIELPDEWLSISGVRLVAASEQSVTVRFGGKIVERWGSYGHEVVYEDYDEVRAVPYDLLIPGADSDAVNRIRLWRAESMRSENNAYGAQENTVRLIGSGGAETITKQLYPSDNYDEGKLLRLSQQYLLVSASLQSIIADHLADYGSLDGFADKIALHLNDTHPALCIPELMRILLDVYSYSWEDAWEAVVKSVSYTNHTILPEALECWREDLFKLRLPRIYSIILEINRRFTTDLWDMYPGDWDRISSMSIVAYGQIRMANLSIVAANSINGVSQLHSEILKNKVFANFYKMTPWKFKNVTNGVAHRRWLLDANPTLCDVIDGLIGKEYRRNTCELARLAAFSGDKSVLSELEAVKLKNKIRFSEYISSRQGCVLDPNSIFDVQIKRMHEYKRQLLNVMKILSIYSDLADGVISNMHPQSFIFGCKAAPGYDMAKKLIKLIWHLSREIESNPRVRDLIKVIFLEDYNVSLAEALIPSADISEQISLAGKEASGTGCMKLMMNGALTIGTLDGANIEMMEACGRDNIYIFGMNSYEVDELWKSGYNSYAYSRGEHARRALERLNGRIGGEDFSFIAEYLLKGNGRVADPFMCLADLESYMSAYTSMISDYASRDLWYSKSLMNIAASGRFSSDVSIKKYADEIWHADPITKYAKRDKS